MTSVIFGVTPAIVRPVRSAQDGLLDCRHCVPRKRSDRAHLGTQWRARNGQHARVAQALRHEHLAPRVQTQMGHAPKLYSTLSL